MSLAEREVDLLVVGAGPAGASAALAGASAGLRVVVVERGEVGLPLRCGEYVPAAFVREVPRQAFAVAQRVRRLALHLPSGETVDVEAPGAVIDRDLFDSRLAEAAVEAGAELWTAAPLASLGRGGRARVGGSSPRALRAAVVIGADGPRTTVGDQAGLGRPKVMVGHQRVVALSRPVERAHLYFWEECRFGYGWLFPKGSTANVGVAAVPARGCPSLLAELLARLSGAGVVDLRGSAPEGRSGLVPCGGPSPRVAAGRVLLAGDAAGQTDALSGAGIVAAVRAGRLAGEVAAAAIAAGAPRRAAPDYELEWRRRFGRHAGRQLCARHEMEALWDRDPERAVRRAWLPRGKSE